MEEGGTQARVVLPAAAAAVVLHPLLGLELDQIMLLLAALGAEPVQIIKQIIKKPLANHTPIMLLHIMVKQEQTHLVMVVELAAAAAVYMEVREVLLFGVDKENMLEKEGMLEEMEVST